MERLRLFVALPVGPGPLRGIRRLLDDFRAECPKVRWSAPENVHLTLAFLGDVEAGEVRATCLALETAVRDFPPFEFELRGIGAFPNPRRPRIVWMGVGRGSEETRRLHESVETALEPFGYRREDRPFAAHLTIGRVKEHRPPARLLDLLEERKDWTGGQDEAVEIRLMSSLLTPRGPVHAVVARAELAG